MCKWYGFNIKVRRRKEKKKKLTIIKIRKEESRLTPAI